MTEKETIEFLQGQLTDSLNISTESFRWIAALFEAIEADGSVPDSSNAKRLASFGAYYAIDCGGLAEVTLEGIKETQRAG